MVTRRDLLASSSGTLAGSSFVSRWGDRGKEKGKGRGRGRHDRSRPTEFVERQGDQFVLNGRSFYFSGTNNFWLRDPYRTRDEIDRLLETLEEAGVNTIRTWGFCSGEGGNCLQPAPGEYDEAAFDLLDYVVAEAGDRGMRLILPLANNWGDYGGMAQYVEWSSTAESHDDFYTDDEAQALYRNFVEYVLTRENGYTGMEYREDPAIMMWELANEPRAQEAEDGLERMTQWVEESAAFVKDIDDNHLLSTGMEGFYNHVGSWAFDGFTGTDYVEHHKTDGIDACSFHLYPESWGLSLEEGTQWIRSHIHTAREEVGKPAYLGEFGVEVDRSAEADEAMAVRNETYTEWYDLLDTMDGDGVAVWQLSHPDFVSDDHHVLPEDEETLDILDEYRKRAEAKTGRPLHADRRRRWNRRRSYADRTPPTTPSSLAVTAAQSRWAALEWDAATDLGESGLKHYAIYVDGVEHEIVGPNVTETRVYGLEADTDYEFAVSAVDWSDNESGRSNSATVRTPLSHLSLVDPCENLERLHEASDSGNVSSTSADTEYFPRPNGGTDGSRFERAEATDTDLIYAIDGAVSGLSFEYHRHETEAGSVTVAESTDGGETWSELETAESVYGDAEGTGWLNIVSDTDEFSVGASRVRLTLSGSVNWSPQLGHVEVRYQTPETDTVPPNAPWGLEEAGRSYTTVDLSWEPATEPGPSGLDHYVILVDGEPTQTVAGEATTGTVAGLDSGTEYEFSVVAVDGVGQESEPSEPTLATTADAGTLSDPCADIWNGPLHEDSDRDILAVADFDVEEFVRPDGSSDEARFQRYPDEPAAMIYEPNGSIVGLRVEAHFSRWDGSSLEFSISTDGGDDWDEISPREDVYNTEGGYENVEYTAADFPMGTDRVRIQLSSDADETHWTPQVGHVDVHFDASEPDAPDAIATAVTDSTADLEWNAVAGASEYTVYVDGTFDHTVETAATTVEGLETGTNYDVTVRSVNSAGNESDDSDVVPIFTTSGASETLEDTCADTDSLAPESDVDNLAVTGFDPTSFV